MTTVLIDQMAHLCGCSKRTIYYWIRDGWLTTVRAGASQRVVVPDYLPGMIHTRLAQTAPREVLATIKQHTVRT